MKITDSFLLSILEQSPSALAIYDSADLNIAFVSQGMLDIWCADLSIIGCTLCECFPNFKEEGFSSILKNVWKTGLVYRAEDTPAYIVSEGTKTLRYFNFEYKPLLDMAGNTVAILHMASDVTDQKLAYQNAEQQHEKLFLAANWTCSPIHWHMT